MSTEASEVHFPSADSFAALVAVNILSLMMLLPIRGGPGWLLVVPPFVIGLALAWYNRRLFRAHPSPVKHATFSSPVPKLREFPLVYGYLLITVAAFAFCMYVSLRVAA